MNSFHSTWVYGGGGVIDGPCCSAEDNCYLLRAGGGTPTSVLDVTAGNGHFHYKESPKGAGHHQEEGAWRSTEDCGYDFRHEEGEDLLPVTFQEEEEEELFHLELGDEESGSGNGNGGVDDEGNNDIPQLTTMKMKLNSATTFIPPVSTSAAVMPLPSPPPPPFLPSNDIQMSSPPLKKTESPVPKTGFSVASNYRHQGASVQVKTPGDSPPSKKVVLHTKSAFKQDKVEAGRKTSTSKAVDSIAFQPEAPYEYALDVYMWKLDLEKRQKRAAAAMTRAAGGAPVDVLHIQTDISHGMRRTLLQWLVAVNRQFDFTLETYCLTVNIMDRFLAKQPINRDCLQLLGLTSFFIAAKQEEVEPPEVSELVSLCARSYESQQFRLMEFIILNLLNFELTVPTVAFFMGHLIEFKDLERRPIWPMEITRDLIERVMCEQRFAQSLPSILAARIYQFLHRNFVMTSLVAQMQQQQQEQPSSCGTNAPILFQAVVQQQQLPQLEQPDVVNNFYRMLYLDLARHDDL